MQHIIPSPSDEPASIDANQVSEKDESEDDSDSKDSEIESLDSGKVW